MSEDSKEASARRGDENDPSLTFSYANSPVSIGTQIGPYKLLSVLGEGGFGIVYLAEQKKPVRRQVALKVIKPGMDSKQVIARFEAEEQALALLDHPNVAQVFDAGTTEGGRPYFVMEHVKGMPITEYCDHAKLTIDERLRLFLQVCEGVQHAHQKGIIHRDIKPSNILVCEQGEKAIPKIIDFGVAKALSQSLTERTLFTERGQLIGTPEYMSPEQADASVHDIDTRSDIYSLGVVLYELLAGVLPFDSKVLREAAFSEIQRVIRDEDPPLPSTRISGLGEEATGVAQNRRTDMKRLISRLHNELEWIPLKAMRKERDRRYKTVSDLAEDVQSYLSGAPLLAGPESVLYRLRKSVHRNRALVAGAATVLTVLIVGIVVSTVFAVGQSRARRNAERQAKVVLGMNEFLNRLLESAEGSGRKLGETLDFLVWVDSQIAADANNMAHNEAFAAASRRMELVAMLLHFGEYDVAASHLERALEIRAKELGGEHLSTLITMAVLAQTYARMGSNDARSEELRAELHSGMSQILRQGDAVAVHRLARVLHDFGFYEDAAQAYRVTLDLLERLPQTTPSDPELMNSPALMICQQGKRVEPALLYLATLSELGGVKGEELGGASLRTWASARVKADLFLLYTEWGNVEEAEYWRRQIPRDSLNPWLTGAFLPRVFE